ncbi:MAG: CCA tRNA nucleotidyltransferase [Streptococcaceae bacterium]|nr:CCA tRNA nucleotidyltransferase [Streptococcaceae bacterium]
MKLEKMPSEFVLALPVLQKIQAHGFEAYFVGGSVRDVLLGRDIHDVDIATSAYPEEVKMIFPHTIDIGIEHGTVLVLAGKDLRDETEHYEITTFRTESKYTDFRRPDSVDFVRDLREDLKRRDFTINAFACNADGEIIDLFEGLCDLHERRLRAVGSAFERFNEDALRIMRAMRFAATLEFEIEPETFTAMKSHASLLTKISVERIFIELDKLLNAEGWRNGLLLLAQSDAWKYLPEFELSALTKLTKELSVDFSFKCSEQAWAALLVRFDSIDVKKFLRQWKVSNEFITAVSSLTEAYKLSAWDLPSLYRFGLEKCQMIDDLKTGEGKNVDFSEAIKINNALQIHDKSEIVVTGSTLMKECNLEAGPLLGKILKTIEEKIVKNELKNDKASIMNFVAENFAH